MIQYVSRIIFILLFSLQVTYSNNATVNDELKIEMYRLPTIEESLRSQPFSVDNLKLALRHYSIQCPEVVLAQAILETGNFTSVIFLEQNNLFGMKHPRLRDTVSCGSDRDHAMYDHWLDSVIDYKLWQDYRLPEVESYYAFLKDRGYAEDVLYFRKLKEIIKQIS